MRKALKIRKADDRKLFSFCVAIRTAVFVMEQQCPILEEYDDYEDKCHHYVAFVDAEPLGTARWRVYKDGDKLGAVASEKGKIERVAVMAEARGTGLARALMERIISDIRAAHPDFNEIILSAQDYAISFYEKFGFEAYGDGYDEAGIPHHMMRLKLDKEM